MNTELALLLRIGGGDGLAARGHQRINATDEGFAFSEQGSVRLCALSSRKRLDFPVVFLYLPYLHRRELVADERTQRLIRNLVYVGISHAMDWLYVFVRAQDYSTIDELITAVRGSVHESPSEEKEDGRAADGWGSAVRRSWGLPWLTLMSRMGRKHIEIPGRLVPASG